MTNYQKSYKQKYNKENKIVTFPLKNIFYEELHKKSLNFDLSINTYAKHIVTNHLNNDNKILLTREEKSYLDNYIHISRGIANNINQLTHKTHLGELVDVHILIKALQHYEEEFKNFIQKTK